MTTILIVDDEPHVRRVLQLTLEREGLRVDTAADGVEGWEKIVAAPPDLLVTDLMMPRMGGKELCQRIQAELPQRAFPILVMSSLTARDQSDWLTEIAHARALEKPLSPKRLLAVIRECLAAREAAGSAPG